MSPSLPLFTIRFLLAVRGVEIICINGQDRVSLLLENDERKAPRHSSSSPTPLVATSPHFPHPRQIIVSSPTRASCDSLVILLEKCLRNLRTIVGKNFHNDANESTHVSALLLLCGGFFEMFLKAILRSSLRTINPSSPREEHQYNASGTLCEESSLHKMTGCQTRDNSQLDHRLHRAIGFMSDALLTIPSTIQRNSMSTGKGQDRLIYVLNRMESALLSPCHGSRPEMIALDATTGSPFRFRANKSASVSGGASTETTSPLPTSGSEGHPGESVSQEGRKTESGDEVVTNVVASLQIDDIVDLTACDLESFDGKMALVLGVLDLTILMLNIERVVSVGPRSESVTRESDEESE